MAEAQKRLKENKGKAPEESKDQGNSNLGVEIINTKTKDLTPAQAVEKKKNPQV